MNAGLRMLAVANTTNRSRRGARSEMGGMEDYGRSEMRGGEMNYPRSGYGRSEMRSGGSYGRAEMGGDMAYGGMESRFRDRRGREHYDNGRFAPMRSEMGGMEARYGGRSARSEMRDMEDRYDGRSEARGGMPEYEGRYPGEMNRSGGERMMAGFSLNGGWRDEAGYEPMDEMERRSGSMSPGGAKSHAVRPFDREMAEEWTKGMEDSDGKRGPHWSLEQAKQVMAQRNISCDPFEFWAAMNAMYSDYGKVFKKHGVGDKIDFYADMAKAFIDDKDAQPDKLSRYFEYIVKH